MKKQWRTLFIALRSQFLYTHTNVQDLAKSSS